DRAAHPPRRRPRGRRPRPGAGRVREGAAGGPPHRGAARRLPLRQDPCALRARRRGRGRGGRRRPLVPELLHLARHPRHLPGGPLRPAAAPRQGARQGAAGHPGRSLR
ncbi:MAG: Acetyltransferase, partial [uncultured Pseudonocardia sp.]